MKIIRFFLLFQAGFFFLSALIYGIESNEKWFSRLSLATVSIGFIFIYNAIQRKVKG